MNGHLDDQFPCIGILEKFNGLGEEEGGLLGFVTVGCLRWPLSKLTDEECSAAKEISFLL